jgi:phosphoglucomutase
VIAARANELIAAGLREVKRAKPVSQPFDYRENYISQLGDVLNLEAIAGSNVSIGADPMGGASVH